MSEKQFTDGLYFHYPHEKSYDKMKIKIDRAKLIEWLMKQEAEIWIKVRESKNGKLYGEVDTWKPEAKAAPATEPQAADESEDLPF